MILSISNEKEANKKKEILLRDQNDEIAKQAKKIAELETIIAKLKEETNFNLR